MPSRPAPLGLPHAAPHALTSGEATIGMRKGQFVFYTPIFVYNPPISDSRSSHFCYYPFGRGLMGFWNYLWAVQAFCKSRYASAVSEEFDVESRATLGRIVGQIVRRVLHDRDPRRRVARLRRCRGEAARQPPLFCVLHTR